MSENFVLAAFRKMGEDPTSVRLMRNKYSGEPAGYAFVSFKAEEAAMDAMHKLNGKPIPGTNPVIRFRLNNATNNAGRGGGGGNAYMGSDKEYSVWVGDISADVDDYTLYRVFSQKYHSIKTAKVILDNNGFSKGYGFVKFGSEEEQQDALYKMSGYMGLGSKPIKICNAVPKPKEGSIIGSAGGGGGYPTAQSIISGQYDYSQYYDAYWQNYNWQNYYEQTAAAAAAANNHHQHHHHGSSGSHKYSSSVAAADNHHKKDEDDEMALVEHDVPLDVDKLNNETIEQDCNLWDALERTKWLPIEQLEIANVDSTSGSEDSP